MENYTHTEKLLPDDLRDIGEFQAICDALNAEIDTLLTYIWLRTFWTRTNMG